MSRSEDGTSSSEDEAMRAVPAGVLGRAGRELLDKARAGEDEYARREPAASSIVDQSQFRNVDVGRGYQAPFVVRQPTVAPTVVRRDDERKRAKKRKKKDKADRKDKKKKRKKKHRDHEASDAQAPDQAPDAFDDELPRRLARLEALLEQHLAGSSAS